MTKKILKIVMLIITIALISVLFGLGVAQASFTESDYNNLISRGASAVNNVSYSIGMYDLNTSNYLYCIQREGGFHTGPYTYTVRNYVKIQGLTATNQNGNTATGVENGVLAYIIGGGDYSRGYQYGGGTRQLALWKYYNTWDSAIGNKLGINYTCTKTGQMVEII